MNARIFAPLLTLLINAYAARGYADAKSSAEDCRMDLTVLGGDRAPFTSDPAQQERSKADCEKSDVYCVDASGYPLPSEDDPKLKSGQELTVKLFGPERCQGVLNVGTNVKQSDVSLFREQPSSKGVPLKPEDIAIKLLAKSTVKLSITAESVTVVVSRTQVALSINGIELSVTPPRYYLDVGILVPFTVNYETVSTSRAPGSTEQFIREERTIHPAAAVALSYFPLGQYAVPRFTGWHGLGVQVGLGANFERINDEFYMGAVYEPVPGAGLSLGLALISMQRLQPGYPVGALVKPNDVPKDEFMGPRFYFGVSLNTEVFQTALKLGEKALVPN